MPVPELVIASTAAKSYPGGVIAVRCEDWLGAGRGTLTTDTDAMACTGTRVEDTQTVTQSIFDDEVAAYQEALDTLVIPMSDIAITDGDYQLLISYRVLGDWDVTNTDTLIGSTNIRFAWVVGLGFHGIDFMTTEADAAVEMISSVDGALRAPHYITERLASIWSIEKTQTLTMRAFAQDGTTASWYLDQLLFLPREGGTSQLRGGGFNYAATSGGVQIADVAPEDGADGGDDHGKFTAGGPGIVRTTGTGHEFNDLISAQSDSAGFDYQRKSDGDDAEYLVRMNENDPEGIIGDPDGNEVDTYAYSLHCVRYRPAHTVTEDFFSRTITAGGLSSWGLTPEGYHWEPGGSFGAAFDMGVDGSEGWMLHQTGSGILEQTLGSVPHNSGGNIRLSDYWNFTGQVRIDGNASFIADGDANAVANIYVEPGTARYKLQLTLGNNTPGTWSVFHESVPGVYDVLVGNGSITGYDIEESVSFRIEMLRYLIRFRTWLTADAEPSTWDYEDFVAVLNYSNVDVDYPYGDDEFLGDLAHEQGLFQVQSLGGGFFSPAAVTFYWDNIKVEYDPLGDPADMTVRMESPEGTVIDDMVVPYGAAYLVYWGRRDWTELNVASPRVNFSSKIWNESTAAELQRAETGFHYFVFRAGGVVSMLWTSATPADIIRVHS